MTLHRLLTVCFSSAMVGKLLLDLTQHMQLKNVFIQQMLTAYETAVILGELPDIYLHELKVVFDLSKSMVDHSAQG